jgi:hypothetical protein
VPYKQIKLNENYYSCFYENCNFMNIFYIKYLYDCHEVHLYRTYRWGPNIHKHKITKLINLCISTSNGSIGQYNKELLEDQGHIKHNISVLSGIILLQIYEKLRTTNEYFPK